VSFFVLAHDSALLVCACQCVYVRASSVRRGRKEREEECALESFFRSKLMTEVMLCAVDAQRGCADAEGALRSGMDRGRTLCASVQELVAVLEKVAWYVGELF